MAVVEMQEGKEEAVVPAPQSTSNKLVLDIDVSDASIADMMAIDRMGSPIAGAFADAVDTMAKFVKNIDIRQRPRRELKAIAQAIMAQFKEDADPN